MPEVKKMSIEEFRQLGYLRELNRRFLHPLGLALEVVLEEEGSEKFGGVWDYRDALEGMLFVDGMLTPESEEQSKRIDEEIRSKMNVRIGKLSCIMINGIAVQPYPSETVLWGISPRKLLKIL